MHLGRDFLFRGKQAASILWISATKPTPRPPSLDRSLETTSTFQRSMSHKRQPQHGTLPSSMFKFTSQCLESNRNGPFDFGGSSRICVLFGRIMEKLIDLEVIFSWEDNYIWICIWKKNLKNVIWTLYVLFLRDFNYWSSNNVKMDTLGSYSVIERKWRYFKNL